MTRSPDYQSPSARRNRRAIGLVVLAITASGMYLSYLQLRHSSAEYRGTLATIDSARGDISMIRVLRAQATRVTEHAPPQPDLVARLHAALDAAGIDRGELSAVSISRPEPVRGTSFRRVTAPIVIERVRPGQVARLLVYLTANEPAWTVSGASLSHATEPTSGRVPADLYIARLTLENLHIDAFDQDPEERR